MASSGRARSSCNGILHPIVQRRFVQAEVKRLCGFPDDFDGGGSWQERYGRAVPPLMMRAVAQEIEALLREVDGCAG